MTEYRVIVDEDKVIVMDAEGHVVDHHTAVALAQAMADAYERPACVYLISASNIRGRYKIGFTSQPLNQRIAQIRYQEPHLNLSLEHTIPCETVSAAFCFEEMLHDLYDSKRVHGEWFNLTNEEVGFIKSLTEGYQGIQVWMKLVETWVEAVMNAPDTEKTRDQKQYMINYLLEVAAECEK